jgi:hypothetical protein
MKNTLQGTFLKMNKSLGPQTQQQKIAQLANVGNWRKLRID